MPRRTLHSVNTGSSWASPSRSHSMWRGALRSRTRCAAFHVQFHHQEPTRSRSANSISLRVRFHMRT